ncbi:MAS20 protein import receptor-domain-containing protein [Syncephalis plumigaleata]|nr:MAS20 protein import receptor-domain-containing protein [Syncephalis plumigaleata]
MKTGEKAAITLGVLALLGVGYAFYFDHKRRNDPKFRRKLKRQRKRAEKERKLKDDGSENATANIIASALARCNDETAPTSVEGKEKYFMDQIAIGESLLTRGPSGYEDAAVHFYRAFRVYPSPMELLLILQKTLPTELFQIIMGMMQLETLKKQERYYELFPPKDMNVRLAKLDEIPQPDGTKIVKRALLASKSFKEGQTVFTEKPVVSALHPSLEGGPFCTHCMKYISPTEPSRFCSSCGDKARFCSDACYDAAQLNYHVLLCAGTHAQPAVKTNKLIEMAKGADEVLPVMAARFLLQTVQEEQRRVATGASEEEYGIWEHLERLKYLELEPTDQDMNERRAVLDVLEDKVPGVGDYFTDERYMTLKGRMLYNTYGVGVNADITDVNLPKFKENTRGDEKLTRIGTGLYVYSSHLTHSCEPNCAIRFVNTKNGNELSLVALQPIAEGDQLNISYVPAGEDNHYTERQKRLAENWRFRCSCARCVKEEKSEPPRDADPLLEEKTPEEIEQAEASARTISQQKVTVTEEDEEEEEADEDEEEIVVESRTRSGSTELNPNAPEFKPTWASHHSGTPSVINTDEASSSFASVDRPKTTYQTHKTITIAKEVPSDEDVEITDQSKQQLTSTIHEYVTEVIEELTEEEAAAAIAAGEAVEVLQEGEVIAPVSGRANQTVTVHSRGDDGQTTITTTTTTAKVTVMTEEEEEREGGENVNENENEDDDEDHVNVVVSDGEQSGSFEVSTSVEASMVEVTDEAAAEARSAESS